MGRAVVDASVLAGVILGSPGSEAWRERVVGTQLVAPELLRYEVANAIRIKGPGTERAKRELMQVADDFPVEHPEREVFWEETKRVAIKEQLTVYDASYVAVAKVMGLPLWTADGAMAKTAKSLGLKVVTQRGAGE